MSSRLELAHIGKVEVLSDKEPAFCLRRRLNVRIIAPSQTFLTYVIHVVVQRYEFGKQRFRQIFIQLELHAAKAGTGGKGKSSPADAAAKAMTARRPIGGTVGKSASTSASVAPSAKVASSVRTGTLVPLTTSAPPLRSLRCSK